MKKVLRNTLLAAGLTMFAITGMACGGKAADKAENLATRICECPDKECAEAVVKDFAEYWETAKTKRASKKNFARVEKALGKLGKCAGEKGVSPATLQAAVQ